MKDVDPVREIRAWRDEFARLHGYDLARISAAVQRETEGRFKDRLIYVEPPGIVPVSEPVASPGKMEPVVGG